MVWITICMVTIAAYNPPPRPEAKKTSTFTSGDTGEEQTPGAANESESSANAAAKSSDAGAGDAPVGKTTDNGQTNAPGTTASESDDDGPLPGEGSDAGNAKNAGDEPANQSGDDANAASSADDTGANENSPADSTKDGNG
jgi:hypothetical protein